MFTPEFVAEECRIPAATVGTLADEIAAAEGRFASHLWRNAASGNLGGWQIARALMLLHVLSGSEIESGPSHTVVPLTVPSSPRD